MAESNLGMKAVATGAIVKKDGTRIEIILESENPLTPEEQKELQQFFNFKQED